MRRASGRYRKRQGDAGGIRGFISVLMLYREYLPEDIEAAVEHAS